MEGIPTSLPQKEQNALLSLTPALATQQLVRFRSRALPPAVLIPVLARERCYSTTGFKYGRRRCRAFAQYYGRS